MHLTRPGEAQLKNSRRLVRAGRLFFMQFFICTHNYHPFPQDLGTGWSTSPGCPGKYIIVKVEAPLLGQGAGA